MQRNCACARCVRARHNVVKMNHAIGEPTTIAPHLTRKDCVPCHTPRDIRPMQRCLASVISIAMASPTPRWNGHDDYFLSLFCVSSHRSAKR
ncbi:MAG: hypothetical protein ACI8W7_002984 [Gammaproteobacteria bacterium]|jgi:hypothetical protein